MTICPVCRRNCDRETLAGAWRVCGTLGFAFRIGADGELAQIAETNRSQPWPELAQERRPRNPPRFKVNGVQV